MTGEPEAISRDELRAAIDRLGWYMQRETDISSSTHPADRIIRDVERHREPEYETGGVYQDAHGDVFKYCNELAGGTPWLGFTGELYAHGHVAQPLRRLVPEEPAPPPDPEITCAACRHVAPSMAEVAWQPDWKQWRCTDPAACHKRQQEAGMEGDVR